MLKGRERERGRKGGKEERKKEKRKRGRKEKGRKDKSVYFILPV